ncbi:MAG: hypothetical protein QG607_494 [Patescibacteria group bacterium]|nr:hypothetical protein [Patescibacteria group bacterium]
MTLPSILIIFLATISVIFSIRLSEHPKTSITDFMTFIKSYVSLWPIAVASTLIITVLTSLYSAIGFLAGLCVFIIGSFVEHVLSADSTNTPLVNLFTAAVGVLGVYAVHGATPKATVLIAFFAGSLIAAWHKKTMFENSSLLRNLLLICIGVLGAQYFYAGSELAIQFSFLLTILGSAAMLVSVFAATHYGQHRPKQMLYTAAISYAIFASATAGWIIPFRPMGVALCIILGIATTLLSVLLDKQWIRHTTLAVLILSSYFIAEFYGVVVALMSYAALAPSVALLPNNKLHKKITTDFLLILLIPIFIHSIATTGRSILFEIGNPFLLVGILMSALFIWGHQVFVSHYQHNEKYAWIPLLIPMIVGVLSVVLFGENSGTILLSGIFAGLILREIIFSHNESEAFDIKNTVILVFVSLFLLTNFLFS